MLGIVALADVMVGTGWLFKITSTGFLPSKDQAAILGETQLPEGGLGQTHRCRCKAGRGDHPPHAWITGVTTIVGYSMLDGQVNPTLRS